MTTTDLLTDYAAQAWAMMTRDVDPMPANIAVDWVRTQMGDTDDVTAVKKAIYGRAANWLGMTNSASWNETPRGCIEAIQIGNFNRAKDHIDHMQRAERANPDKDTVANLDWCNRADRVISLCREVESA